MSKAEPSGGSATMAHAEPAENQIVVYQPNETVRLDVRLENETMWLTQSQMATLFGCSSDNIGLHLKNIYAVGDLARESTTEDFSVVRMEGSRQVRRKVTCYNLDVIISIGHRVKSAIGTRFQQWANTILKVQRQNKNQQQGHINVLVELPDDDFIKSCIFTVRGVQVIADRDLASLYGVTTGALNQAVKRNTERFPDRFMFQLSEEEFQKWKSQIVISNLPESTVRMGFRKCPFVFTEHGVTMLAALLKSEIAVRVSVAIIDTFVSMRRFITANAEVFKRIETVERRQIADQSKNEERFQKIFSELDAKRESVQGVFYNGQFWDARALVLSLVSRAKRSLILIDNWANTEVLDLFKKKREGVRLTIFTSEHYDKKHVPHHKISPADVTTFNAQYPKLAVRYNETFHDRFLIIDDKELYLIGASLKDLGSKCFAFTKLDPTAIRGIKKSAFHPIP